MRAFRIPLVLGAVWLLLPAASAQAQWRGDPTGGRLVCESNDGRYRECRIDGRQRVELARQLSRSACVEGQSWGVRRDAVWVDRGCRGEFAIGGYGYGYGQDDRYGNRGWNNRRSVVCESVRSRHNQCPIDTRRGVVIVRQLSDTRCREGHNWGIMPGGVWVDHGCRAEFASGGNTHGQGGYDPRYGQGGYGQAQTLQCNSGDGRQNYCPADIRRGAELLRQNSRSACVQGQSWGWDRRGIWVSNGCRGEFRVW